MGRTKEDAYTAAYKAICDYIYANGKGSKTDNNIYWETYPVCIKDKCVDGIAMMPCIKEGIPMLKLVPYNNIKEKRINPFTGNTLNPDEDITSLREHRTIPAKLLVGLLEDLKRNDSNKKKK